jgi:hypothetical protein
MTSRQDITVNMDDKQRIPLTRILTKEERELYHSFRVYWENGRIILEPVRQVPEKGHWIYKNPEALHSLIKGIDDAEKGNLHDLGSFAEYTKDED